MSAMLNFLTSFWKFVKKTIFISITLLFVFGSVLFTFAFSSVYADSREAQIDGLTSEIESSRNMDENQLREITRRRKNLLIEQAINNPDGFLRLTRLANKKESFSSVIQTDIESEVETEGDLLVVHFDSKDSTKTEYKLVDQDKKVFDLHFSKSDSKLKTGSRVKLKAVGIGSHLVVGAANQQANTSMQTLSVPSSLSMGETKTAVLLVNFSNDMSTPVSQAEMDNILFSGTSSVNAYYQENSFNQTSLTGQVFGWFNLSQTNSSCETNFYNWSTEADNLAIASGVDIASYNRIVYIFPTPIGCAFGGLGTVGGDPGRSWIFNYHTDHRVYAHEFGHNIGIHHANSLSCGLKAIDVYSNCTNAEYGDIFDVMGNFWYAVGTLQFNGAHKLAAGWVQPSGITTATAEGIYRIYPLETITANTQILKIDKPDTLESYVVSYRKPIGFDIGLPDGITRGASIHVLNNDPAVQSKSIDTTPTTGDIWDFADAALQDGLKFSDPINNIEIFQTSHTQDYVEVQVSFTLSVTPTPTPTLTPTPTPFIDTVSPTVAITYPANGIKVTKNIKINVTASASDNIGVTKVEFRRNGNLICTDTVAPYSCSMFTNSLAGKQVTYKAKAIDGANNSKTSQVTVTTK